MPTSKRSPSISPALRGAGIREVARQAGVSIATVSRVFNGAASVHPDTRERVEHLAASLGYEPSPLGRNLVRGRSDLMGLVVPNLSFPLYGTIMRGIEDVLSAQGMSALLASSHDEAEGERQAAESILRHAVDGGIVINSQLGAQLPDQRLPGWVHVSPELEGLPLRVELDNRAGGALAARHLLERGRQAFGYIGAPGREGREREQGFAGALQQAGQPYRRAQGDYSEAAGEQAAAELLCGPLDALFVAGDLMAAGALRAVHQRGLRVPDDVAVVGFDDAAIATLLYPRLTSVRQPGYPMGRAAAELALKLLEGQREALVIFAPELVVRESTGPP